MRFITVIHHNAIRTIAISKIVEFGHCPKDNEYWIQTDRDTYLISERMYKLVINTALVPSEKELVWNLENEMNTQEIKKS